MLKANAVTMAKFVVFTWFFWASPALNANQHSDQDLFDRLIDMPLEAILKLENCFQPKSEQGL